MSIGDPLVKGTTTKDNIPLLEVKVSHFAKIADSRVRVSAGVGLGLGDFGRSEHVSCFWKFIKANRYGMRLAMLSSNPVLHFTAVYAVNTHAPAR